MAVLNVTHMTNVIYTLTVLSHDGTRTRCWAWFPTEAEACESVLKDRDFYFECGYYDYAVIEKVLPRSIGPHEQVAWFKSTYDSPHHKVERCERPEVGAAIVNWSIG